MAGEFRATLLRTAARSTFWLIGLGFFIVGGLFALAVFDKDVSKLTGPLASIAGPIYVGAGIRAWAKFNNGGSESK